MISVNWHDAQRYVEWLWSRTVPFARDAGVNGVVLSMPTAKQVFTIPTRAPASLLGDQLVGKTAGH